MLRMIRVILLLIDVRLDVLGHLQFIFPSIIKYRSFSLRLKT